jgi:L-histidine Nalpha-methyltransferase
LLETAERVDPAFREDVLAGLSAYIPAVPARWLYDRRGSELFDEITRLPAYYPTRTEMALLKEILPDIAKCVHSGAAVVEFGAGSATKTPLLLEAIKPAAYVPVDISGDYLRESAAEIADRFPSIAVEPVVADAEARILPGVHNRQLRAADRNRPPPQLPRSAGSQRPIADRHGQGEAGRAVDRGL